MPQFYTVSKAFQGKDRDTGEPEVINTKGGAAEKWLVQVENQPVQGWFSVLKKPGNQVKEGDQLYGIIEENNYGKPQFTRMQAPQDGQAPSQNARPQPQQASTHQGNSNVTLAMVYEEVKLVRGLLENQFHSQAGAPATQRTTDNVPEDIDDGPVDLSQIDY